MFAWFFVLYALAGYCTLDRYGVHYDELTQRTIGIENARFLTGRSSDAGIQQHRFFGPLFETTAYLAEQVIYQRPLRDKLLLRRALLFTVFLISVIGVFRLSRHLFSRPFMPALAAITYACWPRIWAEAHYNSKDVLFLSLAVFTIWALAAARNSGFPMWAFIMAGIATSVRIAGLFLLLVAVVQVFAASTGPRRWKQALGGLMLGLFSCYMVFPALWLHPLSGFLEMLAYGSGNPWPSPTVLAGMSMKPGAVPGYYVLLWMLVTLPLWMAAAWIPALYSLFKVRPGSAWLPVWLLLILVSLYLLLFRPTLYNGWRHVYFLYLPASLIAVRGIEYLFGLYRINVRLDVWAFLLPALTLLLNQPHDYLFFNRLKQMWKPGSFSMDYWGIGTGSALKTVALAGDTARVYAFTETVYLNRHLLSAPQAGLIRPVSTEDSADYVLVLNREGQLRQAPGRLMAASVYLGDTVWVLYDRRSVK